MAKVIGANTVVHPGTMVVLLSYTAIAPAAVLGTERFSDHTDGAEMIFIETPKREELFDHSSLLIPRRKSWYSARIRQGGYAEEVSR